VITGMGVISAIGLDVEDFWASMVAGRSGIDTITRFDISGFPAKVAAEVKGFNSKDYMDAETIERTAWPVRMGIAAAKEALKSSRLDISEEDRTRVGVVTAAIIDGDYLIKGNGLFGENGPAVTDPLAYIKGNPYAVSQEVGALVGGTGPSPSVNSVCASGGDVIGTAMNFMRLGYADVMVAGGADCNLGRHALAAMVKIGALSKEADPAKACRPFDLNRNGFVFGEGAGMVVLETIDHAKRRGAPILAEVAGAGWSFDAGSMTAPHPETQALAMNVALDDAGVSPEEIEYINPHGTGTRLNDSSETTAVKLVFGERAYQIPMSSNKSMLGHGATAAGTLEAIANVLIINRGIIPPTINYETPDPECDLDYVPNVARQAQVNVTLSNDFGLGGENVSLVIRRFKGE